MFRVVHIGSGWKAKKIIMNLIRKGTTSCQLYSLAAASNRSICCRHRWRWLQLQQMILLKHSRCVGAQKATKTAWRLWVVCWWTFAGWPSSAYGIVWGAIHQTSPNERDLIHQSNVKHLVSLFDKGHYNQQPERCSRRRTICIMKRQLTTSSRVVYRRQVAAKGPLCRQIKWLFVWNFKFGFIVP